MANTRKNLNDPESDARTSYEGSLYDRQLLSDDELRAVAQTRAAVERGEADLDSAHQYVESIRNRHGYSGGEDGSGYTPVTASISQPFSYASAPAYISRYQQQIDELTASLLGRTPFSYDAESDPLYQQYKASYTRQGQQAMQDTLAQISARTGGLASSYAGTAGQQAYDRYMAALADKLPELQQLAYEMYLSGEDRDRSNLSTLLSLENSDYSRYQDALSQRNADRSFAYGQYADAQSDALRKAQALAEAGDFSGYATLGYTDDEIATLKANYDAANTLVSGYAGRSGGTGGGTAAESGIASFIFLYLLDILNFNYLFILICSRHVQPSPTATQCLALSSSPATHALL